MSDSFSFNFSFGEDEKEVKECIHINKSELNSRTNNIPDVTLRPCTKIQLQLNSNERQVPKFLSLSLDQDNRENDVKITFEIVNTVDTSFQMQTGELQDGLATSDIETGVYEGGFKLWECSLDLINYLNTTFTDQYFEGKKVMELGCGHGLPGIYALQRKAKCVLFSDYNNEVLTLATIPNVWQNVKKDLSIYKKATFYAGDWANVSKYMESVEKLTTDEMIYDIILTAETIYTEAVTVQLYEMIKRHLRRAPGSIALVAAKKYYFGTGGSCQNLIDIANADGIFNAFVVWEVSDYKSNIRQIIQLSYDA